VRNDPEGERIHLAPDSSGPGWNRIRAAVFREPLFTTSTAKRRPRSAKRRRPEWRIARWIRRHPRSVICCLLIAIPGALVWSEKVLINIHVEEPVEWDMRLAARAKMDIKDLLGVIGHGVTVSSVESRKYERNVAAAYNVLERRVLVESSNEFADETLLFVMGHECAHAMFLQGGFLEHNPDLTSYQHLVHEVAADVLGAHLAGRVVTKRGEDGASLTINLLEETRIMSRNFAIGLFEIKAHNSKEWDGNVRTSVGNGYWLDPNCGAEKLIDAVDQICREHEDLWEAARTIANELHNVGGKASKKYAPPDDWRPGR
jgi:hypothetical protein